MTNYFLNKTAKEIDYILENALTKNELDNYMLDKIYPIGSIYMSMQNASPQAFLGGTWEALPNRFLLGASNNYMAGETGGEETHTLTVEEMPSHNHSSGHGWYGIANGSHAHCLSDNYVADDSWSGNRTSDTGGGQPHNNMPPYLAVYMWKRTA